MTRAACARQRRWRPAASFAKHAGVQVVTTAASGPSDEWVRLRAAIVSLVVACVLLAVKYAAYEMTGSAAILSDALESIANVVAALFAVGVLLFAGRPADRNHPYGHGKMEFFSAVFEGGLIAFAAVLIVWKSVQDLLAGPQLRALEVGIALTVAAGLVNAALGWFLRLDRAPRALGHARRRRQARAVGLLDHRRRRASASGWCGSPACPGSTRVAALVVAVNLGVTGARLVRRAAGALLDEEDTRAARRATARRSSAASVPASSACTGCGRVAPAASPTSTRISSCRSTGRSSRRTRPPTPSPPACSTRSRSTARSSSTTIPAAGRCARSATSTTAPCASSPSSPARRSRSTRSSPTDEAFWQSLRRPPPPAVRSLPAAS